MSKDLKVGDKVVVVRPFTKDEANKCGIKEWGECDFDDMLLGKVFKVLEVNTVVPPSFVMIETIKKVVGCRFNMKMPEDVLKKTNKAVSPDVDDAKDRKGVSYKHLVKWGTKDRTCCGTGVVNFDNLVQDVILYDKVTCPKCRKVVGAYLKKCDNLSYKNGDHAILKRLPTEKEIAEMPSRWHKYKNMYDEPWVVGKMYEVKASDKYIGVQIDRCNVPSYLLEKPTQEQTDKSVADSEREKYESAIDIYLEPFLEYEKMFADLKVMKLLISKGSVKQQEKAIEMFKDKIENNRPMKCGILFSQVPWKCQLQN